MNVLGGLVAAAVSTGMLIGGIAIAAVARGSDVEAEVVRIVDGDTIDVRYGDQEHRVRLLNIDTPESVDPDRPVECLGPEATEFLRALLPLGTQVRLSHDEERYDRYDRELAGVFVGDTLVNAEIARAGLGVAVVVGGNDRFYEPVRSAQEDAATAALGLYSPDVECTLPSQLATFEDEATAAQDSPPTAGAASGDLAAHAAGLAAAAALGTSLLDLMEDTDDALLVRAFVGPDLGQMSTSVRDRVAELRRNHRVYYTFASDAASREAAAEKARLETERRAAEAEAARIAAEAEAARVAAEAEAARLAAEQREAADRAAREAERRAASSGSGTSGRSSGASPGGSSASGSSGSSAGSGSSGGGDSYTGCRAYGSTGTSTDDQGRRYTKIDCTTKQPIG